MPETQTYLFQPCFRHAKCSDGRWPFPIQHRHEAQQQTLRIQYRRTGLSRRRLRLDPSRDQVKRKNGNGKTKVAVPALSFQQLTSIQSRESPLNPDFAPFIGMSIAICIPSNRMESRQYPGKDVSSRLGREHGPVLKHFRESRSFWVTGVQVHPKRRPKVKAVGGIAPVHRSQGHP